MTETTSRDAAAPEFTVTWLEDGAIFTIDRPAKLNALTKPVLDGLTACLDAVEARALRLVIITGRGERAFCAGTDLAEMQDMTMEARLSKSDMARALFARLSRSEILSVAAINGLALGGGLELAMACKFRVSAPHATFSLPEIKLELLPAYGGTQFLPALIGAARALDLMLTGRTLALPEELAMGLVDRGAVASAVIESALALAREITQRSRGVVNAIRACVDAAGPAVTDKGLEIEDGWVRTVFPSPEADAGVAAFLARRMPPARA